MLWALEEGCNPTFQGLWVFAGERCECLLHALGYLAVALLHDVVVVCGFWPEM